MIAGNKKVSIYNGILDTTSKYTISITECLNRIKKGKSRQTIESLRREQNESRKDALKKNLPSITFSGIFSERNDASLVEHSGFICLDFDYVDIEKFKAELIGWECTYACWVSPRGGGIKALVRISDPTKHRAHFASIMKIFPDVDRKCANPSRVCYESYDPDIYINADAKVYSNIIEVVRERFEVAENDYQKVYENLKVWLEKKGDAFASGNRNNYVFSLSSAMCRFGVGRSDCEMLIKSDLLNSDSTFSEREALNSINSAYRCNKDNFGSAIFKNDELVSKEKEVEISSKVLEEGFKPADVIYGMDVYEAALDIYTQGYKSAETTEIPAIDPHFKLKRMELTVLTGVGNYGKSQFLNQLLIAKSVRSGLKWAVFSPENNPASEYYFDMTESVLGCGADASYDFQPPKDVWDAAYKFVSEHFFYVYPESTQPTPEYIKSRFLELIIKEKVDGVILDPFNQMYNDYGRHGGRDDRYLESFLADCLRFAQQNNVFFFIVSHPHKMVKEPNGNYPCPDVFDLAGGAMWNNKCDNILVYHRPFGNTDRTNPSCEFHSKKIRRQKIVGVPGQINFEFNRKKRRFYFDGFSPLDGNKYEYNYKPPEQAVIDYETKIRIGNPNAYITDPPF